MHEHDSDRERQARLERGRVARDRRRNARMHDCRVADTDQESEFERFDQLAQKLVKVPKSELDEKRKQRED
jgi:hypothetical protein